MRLEKYIVEGKETASDMELSIVQAFNGENVTAQENNTVANAIAAQLRKYGVKGEGIHRFDKRFPLSAEWKKAGGGANTEPKSDLVIGNHKISLKKAGNSQLISGGKAEAKGVFTMAMNNFIASGGMAGIEKTVEESINGLSGFLKIYHTKRDISKGHTEGEDPEVVKMIQQYEDGLHTQIKDSLNGILHKNANFNRFVIYESATGMGKFGGNMATANYLAVFNGHGLTTFASIEKPESEMITKLISKTKLDISWKSLPANKETGIRQLYSSVRLQVKEEFSKYSSSDLLNEGILSGIVDRIKNFMTAAWNKVKKFVFDSIDNFMEFFGYEFNDMSASTTF